MVVKSHRCRHNNQVRFFRRLRDEAPSLFTSLSIANGSCMLSKEPSEVGEPVHLVQEPSLLNSMQFRREYDLNATAFIYTFLPGALFLTEIE